MEKPSQLQKMLDRVLDLLMDMDPVQKLLRVWIEWTWLGFEIHMKKEELYRHPVVFFQCVQSVFSGVVKPFSNQNEVDQTAARAK